MVIIDHADYTDFQDYIKNNFTSDVTTLTALTMRSPEKLFYHVLT